MGCGASSKVLEVPNTPVGGAIAKDYKIVPNLQARSASGTLLVAESLQQSTSEAKLFAVKHYKMSKTYGRTIIDHEVRILKKLHHSSCVALHGFYEENDKFFLVEDLMMGGTLKDRISRTGPMSEDKSAVVFSQLASATQYIHSLGIVHRGIATSNVLMVSDDEDGLGYYLVKLAGFRTCADAACSNLEGLQELKKEVLWTPPELLLSSSDTRQWSQATDVWGLGLVLYVLLCGLHPFTTVSDDSYGLLQAIRGGGDWIQSQRFEREVLERASADGKAFVMELLRPLPLERPTARNCKRNPWLQLHCRAAPERQLLGSLSPPRKCDSDSIRSARTPATPSTPCTSLSTARTIRIGSPPASPGGSSHTLSAGHTSLSAPPRFTLDANGFASSAGRPSHSSSPATSSPAAAAAHAEPKAFSMGALSDFTQGQKPAGAASAARHGGERGSLEAGWAGGCMPTAREHLVGHGGAVGA